MICRLGVWTAQVSAESSHSLPRSMLRILLDSHLFKAVYHLIGRLAFACNFSDTLLVVHITFTSALRYPSYPAFMADALYWLILRRSWIDMENQIVNTEFVTIILTLMSHD